ncbi:MAG: response regulator transcription factor [bacterium]
MIKVSIVEDHADFRLGLSHLLNATNGFKCIAAFDNAEDAIENLTGNEALLLLDINLPRLSGIESIPLIKNKFPDLKIIMLTVMDDNDNIIKAILAGADGYLLKKTPPAQLLSSLLDCSEGGSPMSASVALKVINLFKRHIPVQSEEFNLSARELEVLQLLVDGFDAKGISEKLFISIETVWNHLRHIYEKLHVHSKSQAVAKALKEGLI